MELSQVKPGDKFYKGHIANGTRFKVKCVWNDPENEMIETVWYLFGFMPCNAVNHYNDKCFINFKAMNH